MAREGQAPAPPIDKPLQSSYLREFSGWATAYAPRMSDPTSLQHMTDAVIFRDGGVGARPGLRSIMAEGVTLRNFGVSLVGSFEHFYLNDGTKALLFAARESNNRVGFRVAVYNSATKRFDIMSLSSARAGFTVVNGEAALSFSSRTTYVRYVQIDNKILALSNAGEPFRIFWVGARKMAKVIQGVNVPDWRPAHKLSVVHPDASWINGAQSGLPVSESPTSDTLVSYDSTKNTYNFGFFYTIGNEIGESAPSQTTVIKAARSFSSWRMLAPNSAGNATTSTVSDPKRAMDQLACYLPSSVHSQALSSGATHWSLYGFTWSDQGAVPPEAVLIARIDLTSATESRIGRYTPQVEGRDISVAIPNGENRFNFTKPSTASQGLVVGDRVILVHDIGNAARIVWSSNRQGEYINFSSSVGGGHKTLTSGNLQVPASVKLWQNSQSIDTVTILCTGLDGYSTSYYMNPNTQVGTQSSGITVMGFEETTATPGTVSPYGVEVLNNALYHPLNSELMKSTAANYNINHKSMTDPIQNAWESLLNKHNIVSSQLDNRLYYLVHNPLGAKLAKDCMGNEVWVFDTISSTWSRWLVQGHALQKLEIDGRLLMSVSRPEGIFVFDDEIGYDERVVNEGLRKFPIAWSIETSVQGANRAHDAYAFLKQVEVTLSDFSGGLHFGIKGRDVYGREVYLSKEVTAPLPKRELYRGEPRQLTFTISDFKDYLQINTVMSEWTFFAEGGGAIGGKYSIGRINFVRYRYTPVSVNVGTELGVTESFEYIAGARTTDPGNKGSRYHYGVPYPQADYQERSFMGRALEG